MEAKQERREDVLKILQMIEDGKIDQNMALKMIAVLEGKTFKAHGNSIKIDERESSLLRFLGNAAMFILAVAGLALLAGLLYVLFVYLPLNAPLWSVVLIYSFLGLTVLTGGVVAAIATTKTMAVGRAAVERGYGRHGSSAPISGEESVTQE
jgi:hypothetical protein